VALSILHLTDIHAGPLAAKDIDLKDPLPEVEAPNMLERLSRYLRALPTLPPDYVIVSGDTTNRCNPIGMEEFRAWLIEQSEKKVLPDPSRILIVPGNHDVKWEVQEKAGWHRERYEDFAKAFHAFPHSHIPGHDPDLNADKVKLNGKSRLGGMKTVTKYGKTQLAWSEPFILDLDKDLLLFGFNSTLGCGVYRAKNKDISDSLAALRTLHKGSASEKWLETIDTPIHYW
jgi:3',5'-cyclic AMP phosphodiesterase CpdA